MDSEIDMTNGNSQIPLVKDGDSKREMQELEDKRFVKEGPKSPKSAVIPEFQKISKFPDILLKKRGELPRGLETESLIGKREADQVKPKISPNIMKIKEIFEKSISEKSVFEKSDKKTASAVKKVSEVFEIMMQNERERKTSSDSLNKKKSEKKKNVKRLETTKRKTVLDRWVENKSDKKLIGSKSVGETGSSKKFVRNEVKQINESQKSSNGDLNPIVSRHSYKRQKESDTILQKQEEIKLILVQKQEMLSEKVKVRDRFHVTEQKNGWKDEKLKKWGAKIQMVENPKREEIKALTTTTTQNETKACWDSSGLKKKHLR